MKTWSLLLVATFTGVLALSAGAADWPQWRGPHRDGISQETGLLKEWPKDGPKLLWENKDIGSGYSTPAVAGDRLFVISNKGVDDEYVQALSVNDGKQIWSQHIGKVGPNQGPQYPGSRSTPTLDGAKLYALGSDGDLVCLEASTGEKIWKKSLRTDFGGKPGAWAYSESPLIDGDALVCTPGGSTATMVALNKQTGDVIWKAAESKEDRAAYSSPIVVDVDGVKQYVQFLQSGVVGVDAKTGKFLWTYSKTATGSPANIPTPVAHAGYVFTSTARGGAGLVKVKAKGAEFEADSVYVSKDLPNSIGGSVLVGDYLYGTTPKGLVCGEFTTGKVKWQDKCVGPASVCYADGRLYVRGESGGVALVEATADGYHEKGRFTPPDQPVRKNTRAWAYPVVADGKLYLRDLDRLWCYDIKEAK